MTDFPEPADLPVPILARWQPLRSGLVNVYKYDEQEFRFERGRLLLRGLNGTGKSRVLAMQLPFLLDGELASHRIEPDGDPAKRVEWNLLMDKEENRLGYTWIEFGRVDEDGGHHFLTLGCGLHARKGAGIPPHARWFFVTPLRVGGELRLVSADGFPLNRERLAAAVGEGNASRTAREHRAAVDRALFGLGDRYEPLLDLLIQLRKPQIMRDFREDDLSRLLGNALPPLAPGLVETIAVSMRALESDREQLEDFGHALRGVEEFSRGYLSDGFLKRLVTDDPSTAAILLRRAIAVLNSLPADTLLLADLAAAATGDSHALDPGQALATLCLRAIRERHGIDGLSNAASRRRAWAAAGVLCDDLSAPVLVLNLAAAPDSPFGEILDLHRRGGLPVFLPLRHLAGISFSPLPPSMREIFVCENPNLLGRAATELGPACAPLVCTNGQLASAAMFLLRRLRDAGATLRVHADFDWAGLRIADLLIRETGARPWQMDAAIYESTPATVALRGKPIHPLGPPTSPLPWNAAASRFLRNKSPRNSSRI